MPSIRMSNGDTITDQAVILAAAKAYYENLYTSKGRLITPVNLEDIISGAVPRLTKEEAEVLEGVITEEETLRPLKKNQKKRIILKVLGGRDSLLSFLKFFLLLLKDVGTFVVRSANYSLEIGKLSISQKQGIIVYIPKGDKDRPELKNWRPISLLNVS